MYFRWPPNHFSENTFIIKIIRSGETPKLRVTYSKSLQMKNETRKSFEKEINLDFKPHLQFSIYQTQLPRKVV